jgi:iron complex outermembrane receptor protein
MWGPTGLANNCGVPAYAALQARFTFNGSCSLANFVRAKTFQINGAPVDTKGIDAAVRFAFDDVMGGKLNFGGDGTYVLNYKVGDQFVEGILVTPKYDAAGKLNYLLGPSSIPRWKGSAFVEFNKGGQNLRWTTHYVGKMDDQRWAPGVLGHSIDAFLTHDITYRAELGWGTTLTASVQNLTDETPPFARLDYSYDPLTANALGRISKIGLTKKF